MLVYSYTEMSLLSLLIIATYFAYCYRYLLSLFIPQFTRFLF